MAGDAFEAGSHPGPDPRAKLIVAIGFAVSVAAVPSHDWLRMGTLTGFLLASFILLRVPCRILVRRMAPLLGLVIAAAIVAAVGAPIAGAADLTVRLLLISASAVAVTASTSPTRLIGAMRAFMVPHTVLAVLLLTARYLHVLDEEAGRSVRAWRSRMVGRLRWRHAVALGRVSATLTRRAVERADRIAWAMVARGFDGRLPFAPLPRMPASDAAVAMACTGGLLTLALWP